jgi:hypothetical protein
MRGAKNALDNRHFNSPLEPFFGERLDAIQQSGFRHSVSFKQSSGAASLNRAFGKMFEAFALVERRMFDDAEKIKADAVKQFQVASELFLEVAREASDAQVIPNPRDDDDRPTIRRMMELSKSYGGGVLGNSREFSERKLFELH